ncbi:unnamed protein product [Owenia fusiformis]|uniref:Nucleolar protein 10 n=1 Tax=Owenia fusiformis TaxID=6347 RepID=A0A8S4N289_OWEFU|nr:unnamed protein product [Owenia fusiformis]
MQVSSPNNIKIYNLSAGKTLPEWLSDRKKRQLQREDDDLRRRIELIQDFEMPAVSNCIQVSKDQQYIFATGTYKPRVRCYDTSQMSMKFERCMDEECVKFKILSDDYSKLLFLHADRHVEFHHQNGRYYRTRIPKFGRDFVYHDASCDLYFVGASSEVYRLNLEQGRFLNSLKTNATESYCCDLNPEHYLFACGTKQGNVECWDPRTRNRVGILDCALSSVLEDIEKEGVPAVTSLKFKDALTMAVGTSTGQILLYDIRSDKPLLVKDHQFGLPIKNIVFHKSTDLVLSQDSRILKLWDRNTGKAYTSIEPGTVLTDMCVVENSGMVFMANEAPKMLTYYIPSLGPAPKWCHFLDSLTEELEENPTPTVYDDYKFVTRTELDSLGLAHLIGSSLLKAYMHGYFMDIRLYNKAKSISDPFAYEEYRRSKIREKIEEARANRVKVKKLPKVNRALAEKLIDQEADEQSKPKKKKEAATLLQDDRFSAMFKNPDFQVDPESEDYKLLNPVVSKLEKSRQKKAQRIVEAEAHQDDDDEREGKASSDEDSSDDEHTWAQEVKQQYRQVQQEAKLQRKQEWQERQEKLKFFEIKDGTEFKGIKDKSQKRKQTKRSLGDRLKSEGDSDIVRQTGTSHGAREMTFTLKKSDKEKTKKMEMQQHHAERRKIRRSAHEITKTSKPQPKYWMGKKVS